MTAAPGPIKEPVWLWADNRPAATPLDHPMLPVPDGLQGTPLPLDHPMLPLPLAPDATLPPLASLSLPAQPLLSPGPFTGLRAASPGRGVTAGLAEAFSAAAGSQQTR